MMTVKRVEQRIFYFSYEDVKQAMLDYIAKTLPSRIPAKFDGTDITGGLNSGSGLTITYRRTENVT